MPDISSDIIPSLGISASALATGTARRRKALIALRLTLVTTAAVFGTFAISGHYAAQRLDYAGVAGVLAFIGITGGVLKAISLSGVDLLGVTAAAAASLALWADTLAYPARERSATTVGKNLVAAHDVLMDANTEYEWAAAVARIEERLSLEAEALLASDSLASRRSSGEDDIHAMSPDEYFAAAATLKRQIWDGSSKLPKLEPDVIVAVNPGGAILGGMLYFMTRASDFLPLSVRGSLREEDLETMLKAAPWQPRKHHLSILLVDASVKSGDSLNKAIGLVRHAVESKGYVAMGHGGQAAQADPPQYVLRTAVIAKNPDPAQPDPVQVDYYVNEDTERFPYGTI